ncbi:virulence protein (VirJ) [bacterium A37T11]|nr:virulence protein (VirJ) [bacterium A37T11]
MKKVPFVLTILGQLLWTSVLGLFAAQGDVPVIIKRGSNPALPVVIYFTGDGGWNDFSQQIAENINQKGYTIFSIDSKKYFWEKKTPEEVAIMISGIFKTFPADFKEKQIVVAGYSFGASVLPFFISRLPILEQHTIKKVFCLSPSGYADFEVKVTTMLNISAENKNYPVIPELKKLNHNQVYIFFGKEENKRDITLFKNSGFNLTLFPGSHGYNKDAATVTKEIDLIIRQVK